MYDHLPLRNEINRELLKMTKEEFDSDVWDNTVSLLANIFDAIQANTYTTAKSANPKNNIQKPKPFPRPKAKNQQPKKKQWVGKTIVVPQKKAVRSD